MNDEQIFLANAYLDGELTADERRIAEADPEVMTEVEQLRALLTELRAVPPPSADARESAISAALASFGSATATAESMSDHAPTAAPVVPFRPRPAYAKFLAVAAAVVAVAGLGIVVSQNSLGGDDSDTASDMVEEASIERNGALTESFDTAEATEGDAMADDMADDGGSDDMAEIAGADTMADDGDELAATPAAEATADGASDEAGDAPLGDEAEYRQVRADFDPDAPITDEDELGVYGVYLIAERDAGRLPSTPNHACVNAQQVLGTATLLFDGGPTPIYVDVREDDGLAVALRTDTCVELVAGSLFAD